jgi:S-adenosylhomocysteine hydrolase
MTDSLALQEYYRIRTLAAFTITNATRRNVNQYVRDYTFPDGSRLHIFRRGYATATAAGHDAPVMVIGEIRAKAWGD